MIIRIFIILYLASISVLAMAEEFDSNKKIYPMLSFSERYNAVDTANFEVVYAHAILDPVLNQKNLIHEMLCIGENSYSFYIKYGSYKSDSVANAKQGYVESWNEQLGRFRKYDSVISDYGKILKNLNNNSLKAHNIIFGQSYLYEEPIPEINWQLSDGTKEILGYECHKATARWRGRDWTAWYSDIPFSDGPYKFTGLPGLILGLEDATGEHKFQAVGIKKDKYPFGFDKNFDPIKTKKEKFEAMQKDHKLNFGKTLANSGLAQVKPEDKERISQRSFYCPIELE
nr:GLPGLI family protein [Parabacteroides goldsteinii]